MTSTMTFKAHVRRAIIPALAATALLAPAAAFAQAASIEGVWKLTRIERTGANPLTLANPQPGYTIYSHGYYATVTDNSTTPRKASPPPKDPNNPSDADKLARFDEWAPTQAQAGTYELKGATLTRHPQVAKNVNAMASPNVQEITIKGNTLTMVSQAPAGQPPGTQTVTMTRVK
jgi:hypothetical protein